VRVGRFHSHLSQFTLQSINMNAPLRSPWVSAVPSLIRERLSSEVLLLSVAAMP
jgi:hypothetical protein